MRIIPSPVELRRARTPLTDGEWLLVWFLEKYIHDDAWECYVQPHLNGLRPDFVLLHPYAGMAVYEVKDWSSRTLRISCEHMSRRQEVPNHPLWQLRNYRDELATRYSLAVAKRGLKGKDVVTAGLVVPTLDSVELAQQLDPLREQCQLLPPRGYPFVGGDDLRSGKIEALLPMLGSPGEPGEMTPAIADSIRPFLVEPDVAAIQRRPLPLDTRQRQLATSRTATGYRRIKGPAGSGKSTVLAARAAELSAQGKRVLVLSFNITLWHYLRDLVVRHRLHRASGRPEMNNIDFWHYHYFCKRVCFAAGMHERYHALWTDSQDGAPATDALTKLALDAAASGAVSYDAALADEGQDLDPDWWQVIRACVKPGGELLLVADASQDLYDLADRWTEQAMEGSGFRGDWVKLETSYRLPSSIAHALQEFGRERLGDGFDPPGVAVDQLELIDATLRWVCVGAEGLAEITAREVAHAWERIDAPDVLAMADVFYICATNDLGRRVADLLEARYHIRSRHTFGRNDGGRNGKPAFWAGDARVKGSTPHSIKGWEARAVVVAVEPQATRQQMRALYVAMSRVSRHDQGSLLTVVSSAPALLDWARRHFEVVDRDHPSLP